MSKAHIDNFTKEELELLAKRSCNISDLCRKLNYNVNGASRLTVKNRLKKYNIDTSHFKMYKSGKRLSDEEIFTKDSKASQHALRNRYIKKEYTPYECSICGQPPLWNNKELTLILDHINGEHTDNRKENLRWVCPNCNQQLETTGYGKAKRKPKSIEHTTCKLCGKLINKKSTYCKSCASKTSNEKIRKQNNRIIPTRSKLIQLLQKCSFSEIGRFYDVSDNAVRKWCDLYGLPRKASQIKLMTTRDWDKIEKNDSSIV